MNTSNNLTERKDLMTKNYVSNKFPALLGILSVIAFPLFFVIWGIKPITTSVYLEVSVLLGMLFLSLFWGGNWIETKWPELVYKFYAMYVILVMPVFFVLASLAIATKLSVSEYLFSLSFLHLVFLLLWLFGQRLLNSNFFEIINRYVIHFFLLGYFFVFWVWLYKVYSLNIIVYDKIQNVALSTVCIVPLFLLAVNLPENRVVFRSRWIIYALAILAVIALVYPPGLCIYRHNYNFFLAPLNDVIHGRVLFVNSTSQYGIGMIYALALVFRALHIPYGYYGLSFIVALLFIFQYVLLMFMLLKTSRNLWISLFGLLVMIYFGYLSVAWPTMLWQPSQSPLRYGLIYLLLFIALINIQLSNRYLYILEFGLLGITSIWSLETFFYTFISISAFYFVIDVLFAPQFKSGIKNFSKRIALQIAVVALSWGIVLFFSRSVSGQIPDLWVYLDYFRTYNQLPYKGSEIAPHLFRTSAVTFVYLASIFFVFFDRLQQKNFLSASVASMMVGMSVAGILQYLYYFVYNIDYHLAPLCTPLIFVLTIWLAIIRRHVSVPFRLATTLALLLSLIMCVFITFSEFDAHFSRSLLYGTVRWAITERGVVFADPFQMNASGKSTEILVSFIEKYAKNDEQIAVFAENENETEALLLTGKTHMLDITDPQMSAISPNYSEYVLRQAKTMAGQPEYIFYDKQAGDLIPLQENAFKILTAMTHYIVVDKANNILVLKRVN